MKLQAEHIRYRAGMYLGRLSDGTNYLDGIYTLIRMVLEQTHTLHHERIIVDANKETITIRVLGKGIHMDDPQELLEDEGRWTLTIVNSLCDRFVIACCKDNTYKTLHFSKGVLLSTQKETDNTEDYLLISLTPDKSIFNNYTFHDNILNDIFQYRVFSDNIAVTFNGSEMTSSEGMIELLKSKLTKKNTVCYPFIQIKNARIDIAFTHNQSEEYKNFSFVNGIHTYNGGTHEKAFRTGLLMAVKELNPYVKDEERILKGLVAAVSIQVVDPMFEQATYYKLASACFDKTSKEPILEEIIHLIRNALKIHYKLNTEFRTYIDNL